MAKPKRAPLYEVLSKSKNPPFWTQGREGTPEGPTEPAAPPPAAAPAPASPPPIPEVVQPPPEPSESVAPGDDGARNSVLRLDGRVVRIALDSTRAAIALFAIVVLLAVAYGLGHGSGKEIGKDEARKALAGDGSGSPDEMDQLRQGPPRPGVTEGLGASPLMPDEGPAEPTKVAPPSTTLTSRTDAAQKPSSVKWTVGLTYIVVQDFAWTAREDALRAQEYLRHYNIETSLEETPNKWYHLITTQGFNWDDATGRQRYDQYLRQIQAIGQRYYKDGGRYKLEGYARKLTQDHW